MVTKQEKCAGDSLLSGCLKQEVLFSSAPTLNTVNRKEAEQQLTHMRLQHAEDERRFLHQLQGLRCEEGAAEEHKKQQLAHASHLQISQSEPSLEELRRHCVQAQDDLKASQGRHSELEARLTEARTQLEESTVSLDSQELLKSPLASERSTAGELQLLKSREEQVLLQVSQLREELGTIQVVSDSVLQDREVVANNCSHLSKAFALQQAQLRSREQTVGVLRAELEALQEATRSKTADMDSLKTDRNKLIQDLKDQAMAVDTLQLELNSVSEELEQRRTAEEALQEVLKEERARSTQLRATLDEEKVEVCRLSQENGSYIRLANQLSTQITEMEEEISTLRDHLREVSSQLNQTADLVLDLRGKLNSKTSELEWLRGSLENIHSEVQQLSSQLEVKDGDLDQTRREVLQLQEVLLDSQNHLKTSEEHFEQEKRRMTQQLMELETLVLALEEVMDPASPHRFVEHETDSERWNLVPEPGPCDD